jgi:hypothetical protein
MLMVEYSCRCGVPHSVVAGLDLVQDENIPAGGWIVNVHRHGGEELDHARRCHSGNGLV